MKKLILLTLVIAAVTTSCQESKDTVTDINTPDLIYFDGVSVDNNAAADTINSPVVTVKINP